MTAQIERDLRSAEQKLSRIRAAKARARDLRWRELAALEHLLAKLVRTNGGPPLQHVQLGTIRPLPAEHQTEAWELVRLTIERRARELRRRHLRHDQEEPSWR